MCASATPNRGHLRALLFRARAGRTHIDASATAMRCRSTFFRAALLSARRTSTREIRRAYRKRTRSFFREIMGAFRRPRLRYRLMARSFSSSPLGPSMPPGGRSGSRRTSSSSRRSPSKPPRYGQVTTARTLSGPFDFPLTRRLLGRQSQDTSDVSPRP